jgi:hypothetical protein
VAVNPKRHKYAVIYEDPSQLARGLDGADTATEVHLRWEDELTGWRRLFRDSLFRWVKRDEYKECDELYDEQLRHLYVFKKVNRAGEVLEEHCVLEELAEEISELSLILHSYREHPFSCESEDHFKNREAGEAPQSDCESLLLKIRELFESEVYIAFAQWIRTGYDGHNVLPFGKEESEIRRKMLDDTPLFTGGKLDNRLPDECPTGLLDYLLNDERMEELREVGLERRINHYCLERAVDRDYFDALVLECSNASFCKVIRQGYMAGLRLMIDTLLSHEYRIDNANDLSAFVKLATSVLHVATEAYADDEDYSFLKLDDADVIRWTYPLMSNTRMHSYLAWWDAGCRLEKGGRTPRYPSTELNEIARRLVSLLQRALSQRGIALPFNKPVTFENALEAIAIGSTAWHTVEATSESDPPRAPHNPTGASEQRFTARELQTRHKISREVFESFNKALRNWIAVNKDLKNVDWWEVDTQNANKPRYQFREESVTGIIDKYRLKSSES